MFFKNLLIYRMTQDMALEAEALELALASKPAREPASQELNTYGFAAPLGKHEDAPLLHHSHGFMLLAARKVERILPGSVVRDEVKAKIDDIEANQQRKVYKKERDQIKDEIIQALLPHAFKRRKVTFAAIDPKAGLIFVNTGSARDAEDLLSTLREVIGSLPVRPMTVKVAPTATLTDWLKTQQAAPDFFILDECTLQDTHEDGGTASLKRQDLSGDETQIHLNTGKIATKLSLAWQDKLSFVIDDKMVIKRLKFDDLLEDQAAQDGGDDALGQLDASFVLMMLTFAHFVPALLEAMGGEEIPEGLGSPSEPATPKPKRVVNEVQLDAFELPPHAFDDGSSSDTLYAEAVNFVRESRRASISAVQRKLKIGYNRAARMIEAMQDTGIVTAMNSTGSREVIA